MDIHTVHGGATADGVAQAHAADFKAQGAYDVRYPRYRVSEADGKISAWSTHRLRRSRRIVIRRWLVPDLVVLAVAGQGRHGAYLT